MVACVSTTTLVSTPFTRNDRQAAGAGYDHAVRIVEFILHRRCRGGRVGGEEVDVQVGVTRQHTQSPKGAVVFESGERRAVRADPAG